MKMRALFLCLGAGVQALIYAGDCVCLDGRKTGMQILKSGSSMVSGAQLVGQMLSGRLSGLRLGAQCTCTPQLFTAGSHQGLVLVGGAAGGSGGGGGGSAQSVGAGTVEHGAISQVARTVQMASAAQAASTAQATQAAQIAQAAQAVQTVQAAQAVQAAQLSRVAQAAQAASAAQIGQTLQAVQQMQAAQAAAVAAAQAAQASQAAQLMQAAQVEPLIQPPVVQISPPAVVALPVPLGLAGGAVANEGLAGAAGGEVSGTAFGLVAGGAGGGHCFCPPPISLEMTGTTNVTEGMGGSSAITGGYQVGSSAASGGSFALEAICLEKLKAAQLAANLQERLATGSLNICLDTIGRGAGYSGLGAGRLASLICTC